MGGGDDAHVGGAGDAFAQHLVLALLQDAQELDLKDERHIADLVEKQGAVLGQLDATGARLRGAGEGAARVTEQLALQQRFGNGAAIDGHERTLRPTRRRVQRARNDLFAGAALAGQKHSGVGGRPPLRWR